MRQATIDGAWWLVNLEWTGGALWGLCRASLVAIGSRSFFAGFGAMERQVGMETTGGLTLHIVSARSCFRGAGPDTRAWQLLWTPFGRG